ncbi:MAG: cobalamin-independent methionine synthase II family protein [Spirochaetaceae bacterium]|nr:MAG: cobalamin-independent methionine synthase II family protein [Spirochaetaceae bacterium]
MNRTKAGAGRSSSGHDPARTSIPRILTTTVGSFPYPSWLAAMPSEQSLMDATRVVVDIQRQAGIDLPTDGELYRFDMNHPETNGMIEYFITPLAGVRTAIGRLDTLEFQRKHGMGFRRKPAGVVEAPLGEGSLNLPADCERSVTVAGNNLKFTVTSPYMLARTLLDNHYGNFESLLMDLAEVLAAQVADLRCACLQVDEANLPGNPEDAPLAARAINRILDAVGRAAGSNEEGPKRAVHLCFGNYGGQTIQKGTWKALIAFLNELHVDHLVLELARRPESDLEALKQVRPGISLGLGVIDIKVNQVESPEEVARRIEKAEKILGAGRVGWVHPDCGFWMLHRSVAERKITALVQGRDLYLGG